MRLRGCMTGLGAGLLLLRLGTAGTTLDWETSVLDDLARDHHVIALDLYGMGFSDRDASFPYGFALWTDQLAQTLDTLGVERVSAIGQSLGGAISLVFAGRRYPRVSLQSVRKLVAGSERERSRRSRGAGVRSQRDGRDTARKPMGQRT